MKLDYSKLKGRIIEKFGSQKSFGSAVGLSENTIGKKLSGQRTIWIKDIEKWCSKEFLDIEKEDIPSYFFVLKGD